MSNGHRFRDLPHEQTDSNAPPAPAEPANLLHNAAQPFHSVHLSARQSQAQQAYYAQWAQYYQHLVHAGGPQGFYSPAPYGMQNMFAPTQQAYPGFSRAVQFPVPTTHHGHGVTMNPQQPAGLEHAQGNWDQQHYGQFAENQTQSIPVASGGTQQLNHRTPQGQKLGVAEPEPQIDPRKHKDPKIMLPAPQPSAQYLLRAAGKPEVVDPPELKLVILDLNGTLLYRPNARKQPTKMIGRPMLPQFLQYLFDNFAVMIWSSARPQNVKILVERGLENYRSQLIASWARDTLGLAPHHYSQNVQCYKDLIRVWASDEVQCNMFGYEEGKRFDQRNTILIDDSSLKAAAQPHNLLEVPEFKGVAGGGIKQDILGEVAGYLELLKMQEDVSKFIHKTPFKADGTWSFNWQHLMPIEGENAAKDTETEEGTQLKPVIIGD